MIYSPFKHNTPLQVRAFTQFQLRLEIQKNTENLNVKNKYNRSRHNECHFKQKEC